MAKRSKTETQAVRDMVFSTAGGRCACTHDDCAHHTGRCNLQLRSRWDAHKKNPKGSFEVLNLVAMCVRCHRNARLRDKENAG